MSEIGGVGNLTGADPSISQQAQPWQYLPERSSRPVQMLRQFRRNVPGMTGVILVLVVVVFSLGAPLFTKADPASMDVSAILQQPSAEHPFGTDDLGRDVYSRSLYGGRISILVGLIVAVTSGIFGVALGGISGYFSRVDNLIMRGVDILMAFPSMLLALAVMAMLGPQLINVLIALTISCTPWTARIIRGEFLRIKEMEFVTAARSVGVSNLRTILRHLLPNSMAVLIVRQTYIIAVAILTEAGLSFLGVGVPPNVPTLGGIVSDGRVYIRTAPWLSLLPGLAISALVLGVNLMGDGLRDVLDPHMKD